jgi:hypothetical protein
MTQTFPEPTSNPSTDLVSNGPSATDLFAMKPIPCALCLATVENPTPKNPNLSSITGTPPNPIQMVKPIIEGDVFSVTAGTQVGIIPNKSVFFFHLCEVKNSS